jgi:tyrosyl-tRNA synthetase
MFGKLMSISDELMARYYPLLLDRQLPNEVHPMEAKKQLASEIVQTYHSAAAAKSALEDWNVRFSEKHLADAELPSFKAREQDVITIVVAAFVEAFGRDKSRADARRLIQQGSVQIDGDKIVDLAAKISLRAGQILRLDKTHAVRIS